MLPVLFIVLSSTALVVALAALFASLRASLGGPTEDVGWGAGPDRGALEDEKNALLRALKDLEYEHEVGKIDDEDYARLVAAYRGRAKEVLTELDRDLLPYLSRAEELAAGLSSGKTDKKKAKKAKKKKDEDAKDAAPEVRSVERAPQDEAPKESDDEPAPVASAEHEPDAERSEPDAERSEPEAERSEASAPAGTQPDRRVCAKCATVNDDDARFCKKCATPLEVEAAS